MNRIIILFFIPFFFLIITTDSFAQVQTINSKVGPLNCQSDSDDTAIWVHPTDKGKSIIFGTDKKDGFCAWTLQGTLIQHFPLSTCMNNATVVYNFNHSGQNIDVLLANIRCEGKVGVWKINPNWTTGNAVTMLAGPASTGNSISQDSYGWACWRNPSNGNVECFDKPADTTEPIEHWKIDGSNGTISTTKIRTVNTDVQMNQSEGFVVNAATKKVYFNEESPPRVHVYYADAALNPKTRLSVIGQGHGLVADLEGSTIYNCGNGNGYLIGSNQGESSFKVWDLQTNQLVKTFKLQGASSTDGLEVIAAALPGYPNGLIASHTGSAYRFYDWSDLNLTNCPTGYLADISGGGQQPTAQPTPTTTSSQFLCDLESDSDQCCGLRENSAVIANFNLRTSFGDFDGNGIVLLPDYSIVLEQFGQCR